MSNAGGIYINNDGPHQRLPNQDFLQRKASGAISSCSKEDTGSLHCTSYSVSQTTHPDTNSFLEYLLEIMYSFFKAHILRVEKFNTYTKHSITNFCVLITQLQHV